jgi:hypothetical protein
MLELLKAVDLYFQGEKIEALVFILPIGLPTQRSRNHTPIIQPKRPRPLHPSLRQTRCNR